MIVQEVIDTMTDEERCAVRILIAECDGDDTVLFRRLDEELPDIAPKVRELLRLLRPITIE
jgi:hypothetical protein